MSSFGLGEARQKICIAVGHLNCGGAERVASRVANLVSNSGADVTIVTLSDAKPFYALDPAVRIVTVQEPRRPKDGLRFYQKLMAIPRLRRFVKEIDAESYLVFMFPTFFLAATLGVRRNFVISIRNDPKKVFWPDTAVLRRLFYRRASTIIAQTEYAKNVIFEQTGHTNVKVIPNFIKINPPLGNRERRNEVVSVGRLIKGKGFDDLLRAFSASAQGDWKLRIVGDGPERGSLSELARDLRISGRVIFDGFRADVGALLESASIFAMCSKSEGFPNALLEAIATPLCSVSYDCQSGPRDLILHGESGFLVDVGKVSEFSLRLHQLMNDRALRMQMEKSAFQIARGFSEDAILPKYFAELIEQ